MKRSTHLLNIHYSILMSLYWFGYATMWASRAVVLSERGLSNSDVGVVTAVALLSVSLVFQPIMSRLIDTYPWLNSRQFAMGMSVVALTATCALLFQCSRAGIAIIYIIIGICLLSIAPFLNSMAMSLELKGVALNYSMGRGIGSGFYSIGAYVMGVLLEYFSSSIVLYVFVASMAGLLVFCAGFTYDNDIVARDGGCAVPKTKGSKKGNLQLLRENPDFFVVVIGYALIFSTHGSTCTYMFHIVDKAQGTQYEMGLALSIGAVMEVPIMLLFGFLRNRYSIKLMLRVSAIGFLLRNILFFSAGSMAIVYVTVFLQFLECGLSIPVTVYYVAKRIGLQDQVKGQSLMHLMSNGVGSAIGVLVGGYLLDFGGIQQMLMFSTGCALLGAMVIFAGTKHIREGAESE